MTTNRVLFVTWQDRRRRRIFPVGRLTHRQEPGLPPYEFRYIRGALEAGRSGFQGFLAFPDLERVYTSDELFPFFANRVMPTTRPDYVEYLDALGLSRTEVDPIAILCRSGGRRETDPIEVVPMPVPDAQGEYVTHFMLRGFRHVVGSEERIARLEPGERLLWMADAQNPVNDRAIMLRTEKDAQLLGWVPDYLVMDVKELIDERMTLDFRVEKVNPLPAPRHHRLLCRIAASWPEGFRPFQGNEFQPLAPALADRAAEPTTSAGTYRAT